MNILAIETSTKQFSLAVMKDGKTVCAKEIVLKKVLSDSIVPAIKNILKSAKLSLAKIDGFAVGLGPGSFTSLRVGVATVKALAFVTGKPVVGVSSLDAIAVNALPGVIPQIFAAISNAEIDKFRQDCCGRERNLGLPNWQEICVICDARRNLVYACIYSKANMNLKPKTAHLLCSLEKLLDQVKGRTLFVGDGVALFRPQIERRYAEAARENPSGCQPLFADEKSWFPKAESIARLASPRFLKKKFDDVDKLVPLYLYPEDCQVQRR